MKDRYREENIGSEYVISGDDEGLVADVAEMIFDPARVEPGGRVVGRPQFDAVVLFGPEEEAAHWDQHQWDGHQDGPPRVDADPSTQSAFQ